MVSRLALIAGAALAGALAFADELPPEACVRLLREARIAHAAGHRDEARAMVRRAVEEYPKEVVPVMVLLQLSRDGAPEAAAAAREQLRARLFAPEAKLPAAAFRYLIDDAQATPDEIALLRSSVDAALAKGNVDPKLLEAAYRIDLRLDDRAAALAIVERQIAAGSRPQLLWRRLNLCASLERWSDVTATAKQLLAADPKDDFARASLISALIENRQLDDARAELDALLGATTAKILPSRMLLVPLAWAYWDAGRDADAHAAFKKASEIDPAGPDSAMALSLLFATPEARASQVAKVNAGLARETNPAALFEEGTKRLAAGDAGPAYDLLARAVAAEPGDDVWQYNLAMAAIKLERYPEAETAIEASIAIRPDRAQSYLQLGRVREALNRCEQALAPLDKALALRPDLNEAHFYRYKCFLRLNRPAEAAKALEVYKAGKAAKP